jgi:hypothetical protein
MDSECPTVPFLVGLPRHHCIEHGARRAVTALWMSAASSFSCLWKPSSVGSVTFPQIAQSRLPVWCAVVCRFWGSCVHRARGPMLEHGHARRIRQRSPSGRPRCPTAIQCGYRYSATQVLTGPLGGGLHSCAPWGDGGIQVPSPRSALATNAKDVL